MSTDIQGRKQHRKEESFSYSLNFLLALNTVRFVTNYVCKQITIHGRQSEFPEAKIIKLGIQHVHELWK